MANYKVYSSKGEGAVPAKNMRVCGPGKRGRGLVGRVKNFQFWKISGDGKRGRGLIRRLGAEMVLEKERITSTR